MKPVRPSFRSIGLTLGVAGGALAFTLIVFSVAYAGKILPGVTVNGVAVGGLDRESATKKIQVAADSFRGQEIPVRYENTTLRIPVSGIGLAYTGESLDKALAYGNDGSLSERLHARLRSLLGRSTKVTKFTLSDTKLTTFISQVEDDVTKPVANASLNFDSGEVSVVASQPGRRLDRGRLTTAIKADLSAMIPADITAPVYLVRPTIDEYTLAGTKSQARAFASAPIDVVAASQSRTIDQPKILDWIDVSALGTRSDMVINPLQSFYPSPTQSAVKLEIDKPRVESYVAGMAEGIGKEPVDAILTVQDGKVVIATHSRDGIQIDQAKAVQQIIDALGKGGSGRDVTLATSVKKPTISDDNVESLGLKDLIGEGVSSFPGSSADRLTNVRVGTKRYQNVLIKPGEIFSFGKQLGDVGPEQGYRPSLVIIGNKEEKQYGGGLCQVSSTLYRAALTAGLPITQRTNHSFAINEFYTAPYGVPGVDATIYYPDVDLKFKNDTPGYILIQTQMTGTNLKFDLYGTRTKSGVIRGPEFVSGSLDATQPSHTVFYRDVVDLSGSVIKTDTVNTYYKSSKDFTIVESKGFN